jgi:hypothetical protein
MRPLLAVLVTALAAGTAPAKLELRDIQASHGQLGPQRKSDDYVLGDEVYYRYTIAGVKPDADGRLAVEIHLRVTDAQGKEVLKAAGPVQAVMALGGDTLPGNARVGLNDPITPGEYEVAVEVRDLRAKESASFKRTFTCKPVEFAAVRVRFAQDPDGKLPAPVGGQVGQALFVRTVAVGFDRSRGEIDVQFDLQVFDKQGKPVTPKPIRATVHNEDPAVVKQATVLNFKGEMILNRPGEFVLRLTLTDTPTKKTTTFETPLRVAAP